MNAVGARRVRPGVSVRKRRHARAQPCAVVSSPCVRCPLSLFASQSFLCRRAFSASPADYLGSYHAFLVENVNAPSGSVYVSFGDWSGGKVMPGNSQPAILNVGTLAPGASKMVYFYLQSPDSVDSTVGTTFVVKVWRFRPSSHANSGFTSAFNFTLSVKDSLDAAGEI